MDLSIGMDVSMDVSMDLSMDFDNPVTDLDMQNSGTFLNFLISKKKISPIVGIWGQTN